MARTTRRKSETGIYHIMLRGINKQKLFLDNEDYKKFLYILSDCKKICKFEVFAFCLMSNHVHLLIKEGAEPLEQVFKRFGARFVYWYNKKYDRIGPLFQGRFKSEPVDTDEYLLTVLRYIHNNPVKAKMVDDMFLYKYSSAGSYLNGGVALVDTDAVYGICERTTLLDFFTQPCDDKCLDIEMKKQANVSDVKAMTTAAMTFGVADPEMILSLPEKIRKLAIPSLKDKGLSLRQISKLTGISLYKVRRS